MFTRDKTAQLEWQRPSPAFDYLFDGLQLSHEAVAVTKHLTTIVSCFNETKLHLVLDLDHTFPDSTPFPRLTEAEKYLIKEAASISKDDLRKWNADGDDPMEFLTKLRPFVSDFLEDTNKIAKKEKKTQQDVLSLEEDRVVPTIKSRVD